MRPNDPRYNALKLAGAPHLDATVNYIATRSPVSNHYERYLNAERLGRDEMMQNSRNYFSPWDAIHEANPQEILDSGEKVTLPPLLIMQGELDDNVRPAVQENSFRGSPGHRFPGHCRGAPLQGRAWNLQAKPLLSAALAGAAGNSGST